MSTIPWSCPVTARAARLNRTLELSSTGPNPSPPSERLPHSRITALASRGDATTPYTSLSARSKTLCPLLPLVFSHMSQRSSMVTKGGRIHKVL